MHISQQPDMYTGDGCRSPTELSRGKYALAPAIE